MSLPNRRAMSTTSRLGRSPRRTRTHVEGREGPEADRALVSQAAEDGVLLEADVVGERGATSTTSRLGGSRQG
jgi:hypothetical protein